MPDNSPQQPKKLAVARPTMYIDVALVSGQNFSLPVNTARELRDELTFVLNTLDRFEQPSGIVPQSPRRRNTRKTKAKRRTRKTNKSREQGNQAEQVASE